MGRELPGLPTLGPAAGSTPLPALLASMPPGASPAPRPTRSASSWPTLPNLDTLTRSPAERRGQHPRLRELVDAGPEHVEAELREFLRQAPPEEIAQNPRAWWQTALEYLDLPRNAVFNLVNNLFGAPLKPTSKETFAGLRKIYGSDLLRSMGWKPDTTIGKVGQFLAGLGIDFVSDPLTWLSGFGGLARGTLKTAATGSAELARDAARAARTGHGLTAAGRHVQPETVDRLRRLTEQVEDFLPEVRAGERFNAVESAASGLPAADLLPGRWGLGLTTTTAKHLPAGHIVAGPVLIAGQAIGALAEGAGRASRAIPGVGQVSGPVLEGLGRAIQAPVDLLGAASDALGTPLSFLPSATTFKAFREMPVLGGAIAGVEQAAAASPFVQEMLGGARQIGSALVEQAGKIGIGKGGTLQQLARQAIQQAERQVRYTDTEFREVVAPLIKLAAKETGIAEEHLRPLWSVLSEYQPQIARAAESGSELQLRAILDEQETVIREHLRQWYPDRKVVKATDDILEAVGRRRPPAEPGPVAAPAQGPPDAPGGALPPAAEMPPDLPLPAVSDLELPGMTYGRHSLAYKHGITGSQTEANQFVRETLRREKIDELRQTLGGDGPLIFVPVPSTSGADNRVPKAIAEQLARELGGDVAELLSTGTYRSRRTKGQLAAIANPRDLVASDSAELPAAARLILVDDVAKTGGTIRDAAAALREVGLEPDLVVVGAARRGRSLTPTRTQRMELEQRAGTHLDRLTEAIGRPLDDLTAVETETLLRELRQPGGHPRELALRIERLRELPLPAAGRGRATYRPGSRRAIEHELINLFEDLRQQELIVGVESRHAMIRGQGASDIEVVLAPGYRFTPAMAGEARDLKAELRGRGYAFLEKMVTVDKPGSAPSYSRPMNSGDDAVASMRSATDQNPIELMASSMIAYHRERSRRGKIEQVLEYLKTPDGQQQLTPRVKDLVRRYEALTGPAETRALARGKRGELVEARDLEPGDQLTIAGDPHTVVKKDETGTLIRDGLELELAPGEPLVVDAGSHRPDALPSAVMDAVAQLEREGIKPTVTSVLGTLRENLPSKNRERELARLVGVERIKGNRQVVEQRIEQAMLRAGVGSRGIPWENILRRLEEVEAGVPGGHLAKLEGPTHPYGQLIRYAQDPQTGAQAVRQELTDLGRQALAAMRANLTEGGQPAQVARLVERINALEARKLAARRAGQTIPRGLSAELSQKRQVLERMGRRVDEELEIRMAREAAEALARSERPLPPPTARELFDEPIARVVEQLLDLERRTRTEEARLNVADISKTTERGLGYWPRIIGRAQTVAGKMYRSHSMKWENEWRRAAAGVETAERADRRVRSSYDNLLAVVRNENRARRVRGLEPIPEPSADAPLALEIARILDRFPDLAPGHGHQLRRQFLRENMLHEVNALAEYTGIAFETDPVTAWMKRRTASHFAVAGADFLEAVIRQMGETGLAVAVKGRGPVPKGFSRLSDSRFGTLARGYAFADEVVKEFERFTGAMKEPHAILRAFDWATSQWRTMVLGVFPYTTTNLLSGVFQANQFNAFSYRSWAGAKRLMEDVHLGRNWDAPIGRYVKGMPDEVGRLTVSEFWNAMAVEHGALGRGNYGIEMEQAVAENFRTSWGVAEAVASTLQADGKLPKIAHAALGIYRHPETGQLRWDLAEQAYFKAFRAANVAVEDWMKLGFVMERMRQGDTLTDAVQKGRLALNQSADLTDFERSTFRRLIPFWGWMKGNALLQMMQAVDRPKVTAMVAQIRGNLEAAFAGDETLPLSMRPRHVAEELGTQLSGGTTPDVLNLTRIFPIKELGTTPLAGAALPAATTEAVLQGVNPLLKGVIETAANRDFYWDRPITEYEGQRRRWLGMNLSPQARRIAGLVRPLNLAEQISWRGVPTTVRETGFSGAQALGLRTFPVDTRRQVYERQRQLNSELGAVMRDFSRARDRAERGGRDWRTDPEVKRLAGIYQRLRDERDALPLHVLRDASFEARRDRRLQRGELLEFAAAN